VFESNENSVHVAISTWLEYACSVLEVP